MIRNRFQELSYDQETGCFLGGGFHCKGGGGESTTSTAPSKEQRAILQKQLDLAEGLQAGGELEFFGDPTLAGQDPLTGQGQAAALGQVGTLQNLSGQQQEALNRLLGGGGLNLQGLPPGVAEALAGLTGGGTTNIPGVTAVGEDLSRALTAPITRQLQEQILPGISSAAVSQGAFGGDRADILREQATSGASERIAEVLSRASIGLQGQQAQQLFQQEQLRQQGVGAGAVLSLRAQQQLAGQDVSEEQLRQQALSSGLGFAPQVAGQALLPSQLLSGVGEQREQRSQAEIDAERERFEFGEFAQTDLANRVNSLLSGLNFGTVTTTKSSGGGK